MDGEEGPPPAPDEAPAGDGSARGGRKRRRVRPHPYAGEASTEAERRVSPRAVALAVLGLATAMLMLGLWAQGRFGYFTPDATLHPAWEAWTRVPLFGGLALLGLGLLRRRWARPVAMLGWVLFGAYWAMTARDLFVRESADYVNALFAMVGVYLTVWLAYHTWLDKVRDVADPAVRFLQISVFVSAGSYFLIDKIQALRVGLIHIVSNHTRWMLDLFGQGDKRGLVFLVDEADNKSPTTFFYPDVYCESYPHRTADDVSRYCQELGVTDRISTADRLHPPGNWFEEMLQYSPDGDLLVVPVSIILACTALQTIMLFVGLFVGTQAGWRKILKASLVVGGLIYVLNLVRNTGIIWFYGQGHASFWVMHNAIGKGGSLLAILAIAFGVFRHFPEFLRSLVGVLDLVDRDGPLERTLRIGRRRPENPAGSAGPTDAPAPPTP